MPLSDADPLTRRNQREQLRLVRETQRQMLSMWALMDFYRLDESTQVWLPLASKAVLDARAQSATLAANWYAELRIKQIGEPPANVAGMVIRDGVPVPVQMLAPDDPLTAAVATSLRVTGPATVKRAVANGLPRKAAMQRGLGRVLGSVQRQVLNGGRQATIDLLGMEPTTTYYQRVTASASVCSFCDMLAERGPVYTAHTGAFKAHDFCACTIEPKFRGTKKRRSVGSGYGRQQWTEYQNVAPLSGPALPTR